LKKLSANFKIPFADFEKQPAAFKNSFASFKKPSATFKVPFLVRLDNREHVHPLFGQNPLI
jgi:hypothetical protein